MLPLEPAKRRFVSTHLTRHAVAPMALALCAWGGCAVAAPVAPAGTPHFAALKSAALVTGSARQRRAAQTAEHSTDDVTLDFVAADINDVLKALAVQTGANIVSSADVKGTVTVSLSHVSLEQALDMVAKLSGYQYAKVGGTYVVGSPSGIQTLTGGTTGEAPVTSVLTFNYASPDDVMNLLKNRFPNLNVATGTSVSGEKAGAGAKALILSGDATLVAQARDLVTQVDTTLGANVTQQKTETYDVRYASISDLITVLASVDPNLVVTPGPSQGFGAKAPSAGAAAASSGASGTSSSSGAPASGSGASGSSQASSTGPTMLLLTGTPSDIARARQVLSEVDVAPAQILFETKVTEITNNDQKNIGLNWDFSGAKTTISELYNSKTLPVTTNGITETFPDYPGQILKFGTFGRSQINNLATVSLDALIANNHAHLLADPNIAALNGQPAQVFIGDTINYVQSITQTTTGQNVTTASVQVGVILRVTGRLNADGYITLNIHPEVSQITGYLTVPGGGSLPQVSSRYADTTIRVKNGDTIAIGGLIQENDLLKINKVPFFGDLPFFGQLFRDTQHGKVKSEVVFFLKTSVMNES